MNNMFRGRNVCGNFGQARRGQPLPNPPPAPGENTRLPTPRKSQGVICTPLSRGNRHGPLKGPWPRAQNPGFGPSPILTHRAARGQPTKKNRSGRGPGEAGAEYEPIWSRERPVPKGSLRKNVKMPDFGPVENPGFWTCPPKSENPTFGRGEISSHRPGNGPRT